MAYPVATPYGEILVNTVSPHPPTTIVTPPDVQAVINKTSPTLPPTQVLRPPHGGGLAHP